MPEFDAIILAGGRGSRLGGVSKADLVVGGRRLLDVVLEAVRRARTTVVVGPVAAPDGVLVTVEDPPGTGPAAGIVAGLEAVAQPAGWTVVLACDLPGVQAAVPQRQPMALCLHHHKAVSQLTVHCPTMVVHPRATVTVVGLAVYSVVVRLARKWLTCSPRMPITSPGWRRLLDRKVQRPTSWPAVIQ